MNLILTAVLLLAGFSTAPSEQASASSVSAALAAQVHKALDTLEPRLVALESGTVRAEVKGELPTVRANFDFARNAASRRHGLYALLPLQDAWISLSALEAASKMEAPDVVAAGPQGWYEAVGSARAAGAEANRQALAAGGRADAIQALATEAQRHSDVVYRTARQWLTAELPIGFYYYTGQSEGYRAFAAWLLALDLPAAGPRGSGAKTTAATLVKSVDADLIAFSKAKGYVRDKHRLIVMANTWIESAKQLLEGGDPLTARYAALTSISFGAQLGYDSPPDRIAVESALAALITRIEAAASDATLPLLFAERAAEALLRGGDAAAANLATARALVETVIPRSLEQE
jgi:hypothetical protein